MKKITILAILGMFVFGSVFSFAESAIAAPGDPIPEVGVGLEGEYESLTSADLGVSNVGALPTSRWYFLKELKRGISRVLIFGGINKAEFELKITNEIVAEILEVEKKYQTKAKVSEARLNPDAKAIEKALKKYTKAQDRLNARLTKLTENYKNPNVASLLEQVEETTIMHLAVLNELSSKNKEYVGHVSILKREITPTGDEDCDGMGDDPSTRVLCILKNAQNKTQDTIILAVEKDSNAKGKATDQIVRAEVAIKQAELIIKTNTNRLGIQKRKGLYEWIKASLDKSRIHLERAKKAFDEEKYGEAFGQARSAEVIVVGAVKKSFSIEDESPTGEKSLSPTTEMQIPTRNLGDKSAIPIIQTPKPRSIPENIVVPEAPTQPVVNPTTPEFCSTQYEPVCGENGKTYSNSCNAGVAKVVVKYTGECRVVNQPSTNGAITVPVTTGTSASTSGSNTGY